MREKRDQASILAPDCSSFLALFTQSPFTPDPDSRPPFLPSSHHSLPPFFPSSHHSLRPSHSLGTPETSLRGRRTLKALRALTSKPAALPPMAVSPSPLVACSRMALNNLQDRKQRVQLLLCCVEGEVGGGWGAMTPFNAPAEMQAGREILHA